jgi:uncharacterized protein YndB with AHSA1/START domain
MATAETVRKSVTVELPQERAFELFTAGFSTWWPLDTHHIGKVDATQAVIEPRTGGRCYEIGVDGSECDWGRVFAWEPPSRFVMGWMLNEEYAFDPDESRATEVEVQFIAEGPRQTRVELEHRGFEKLGAAGEQIRTSVGGDGGWGALLQLYAAAAARA